MHGLEAVDLIYNKGEGEVKGEEDTPRNAKTGSGVFSELYECSDQCKAFLNQVVNIWLLLQCTSECAASPLALPSPHHGPTCSASATVTTVASPRIL